MKDGRSGYRRMAVCLLVSLAAAGLCGEAPPRAQQRANVTLSLLITPAAGPTLSFGGWACGLGVGEGLVERSNEFTLAADPDTCRAGSGTASPEIALLRHAYAWTADARLVESTTGRLVLSASWKRFTRGPEGTPVESGGGEIPKLTLGEGDRVLLDYVSGSEGSCARSFALELTAQVEEDPALAERQIGYDLWLVHEVPGRKPASRRSLLTAKHGQPATFAFPKESLEGAAAGSSVDVEVTGRVRGRLRADGSIDLALMTIRSANYASAVGGHGASENGEKQLTVQPGEAIRVDLPAAPRGDDYLTQRLASGMAGHSFALILTARPVS